MAEWPGKQFGMYGDDVETHLAAKLMHWGKHEILKVEIRNAAGSVISTEAREVEKSDWN